MRSVNLAILLAQRYGYSYAVMLLLVPRLLSPSVLPQSSNPAFSPQRASYDLATRLFCGRSACLPSLRCQDVRSLHLGAAPALCFFVQRRNILPHAPRTFRADWLT